MRAVAGVDVGGTFTDLVAWDGSQLVVGKVPSTPQDQSRGVVAAIAQLDRAPSKVVHGTTVATNALLERRGATTALVTTEGFEDVLAIGRQHRPSLYDSMADRPEPLATERFGVSREDPTTGELPAIESTESIAISLLYGFRSSEAEAALAARLATAHPGVPISMSSEVVAEFREFERTSTTVLNAYLRPEMGRYLDRLDEELAAAGVDDVAVMRSSGGLMSLASAGRLPAAALLSGPAGGVVAAAELSIDMGFDRAISFDMGGTSTDVSRIENGQPQLTFERPVARYPCRMPSVDIHTVGAGGGSVGWRDSGGSLRVGPQSAGAAPGPAAYGRGGELATVTDAHVMLGRIGALGKSLALDKAAAESALAGLGEQLGLGVTAIARGMLTVVEETMAGAIRRVSVEEGVDPRGAVLVAFGGAGGLHAAALARRLDMAAAVVPKYAGVFSALGLLLSPPRVDAARSISHPDQLGSVAAGLEAMATSQLLAATGSGGRAQLMVDLRYVGQAHELTVPYLSGDGAGVLSDRFHELHAERNGFARHDDSVEVVTVRAAAIGEPMLRWSQLPQQPAAADADQMTREMVTSDGTAVTGLVYRRDALSVSDVVAGPAVIEDGESTTYLDPGDRASVAANGAVVIEW